jgi:hypothetical protein
VKPLAERLICAYTSPGSGTSRNCRTAFVRWSGSENLEERVEGIERIDPVVLRA